MLFQGIAGQWQNSIIFFNLLEYSHKITYQTHKITYWSRNLCSFCLVCSLLCLEKKHGKCKQTWEYHPLCQQVWNEAEEIGAVFHTSTTSTLLSLLRGRGKTPKERDLNKELK